MNEQNLIPFKSVEEAREKGRKGGLSCSPKKSFAAKMRCLREKGLTDEYSAYLHQSIIDGEFDIIDIKHFLNRWIENHGEKDRKEILKLWLEWHKIHHGSKEKNGGDINVQVNVLDQLKSFYRKVEKGRRFVKIEKSEKEIVDSVEKNEH